MIPPLGPRRTDEEAARDRDAFHAHLDECQRCATQIFNLCPIGANLLEVAAVGKKPEEPKKP